MYESSDEQLTMSYAEQREQRLQSAISEWTLDDDITADATYDSIIKMIKDDASYFKKQYDKQMSILFKMGYYGPLDDVKPEPHLKSVPTEA
jgi:ABC-type uncharacterized transport system substrate-binding protein